MTSKKMLEGILEHSQGDAALRAFKELRRPTPTSDEMLWRIVRQALNEPESEYPAELLESMREYDRRMTSAQSQNKVATLTIRLTVNERENIRLNAQRQEKTISEYVRDRCVIW